MARLKKKKDGEKDMKKSETESKGLRNSLKEQLRILNNKIGNYNDRIDKFYNNYFLYKKSDISKVIFTFSIIGIVAAIGLFFIVIYSIINKGFNPSNISGLVFSCIFLPSFLMMNVNYLFVFLAFNKKTKQENRIYKNGRYDSSKETPISSFFLKKAFIPVVVVLIIMDLFGIPLVFDYIGTFIVSVVISIPILFVVSIKIILKLIEANILVSAISNIYLIFIITIPLFLVMVYLITYISFYILHHDDYVDVDENSKKDKFNKLWNQIKKCFFVFGIIITVICTYRELRIIEVDTNLTETDKQVLLLNVVLYGIGFLVLIDTYLSKKDN